MDQTTHIDLKRLAPGARLPDASPDTLTCDRQRLLGVVCLSVIGELDVATVSSFRSQVRSATDLTEHLVLDFSRLRHIDATGIHALLDAYQVFTLAAQRMALVAVPPRIQRVLAAFGVDEIVPVFSTLEVALSNFRGDASSVEAGAFSDTKIQVPR
jgi:anti-sigma B factor antagonist